MIILISLVLLSIFGIILACKSRDNSAAIIGIALTAFSGVFLIMALVSLITNPVEVKSDINKFLATEATIEQARKTGVDVENAAIQHKIIESNQWLAKEQYYNSTIFELWIPDEIDKLKPIR
jgi:drug/metabolite transporter superfamily protein YnfA